MEKSLFSFLCRGLIPDNAKQASGRDTYKKRHGDENAGRHDQNRRKEHDYGDQHQ